MSSYLTTSAAASTYYLQTNPSGYLNTTDIGGGSAVAGADILDALQESNAPSTGNPYATQGDVYTQVTSMSATLLAKSSNLSDLASASLARGNLGLGTAATFADTAFLKTANNLSDVTASTARTNLGLGTAAVEPATKLVPAGGTTGQVLVKASNSDWDDTWATISSGATWGSITEPCRVRPTCSPPSPPRSPARPHRSPRLGSTSTERARSPSVRRSMSRALRTTVLEITH